MKLASRLSIKSIVFAFLALIVITGCSSNSSSNTPDTNQASNSNAEATAAPEETNADANTESGEEASTQFPITIKHAFGETIIESKPERVATIAWANHDVALALGVVPVGFSAANYGVQDDSGLLPWTAKKLEELGATDVNVYQDTAGLDYEAISDSNPEVILAAYSGITQEEYDTLSQIAPVVAYPTVPWVISWREQVQLNAAGMGMVAEGEQLIKETEQLIADKASQYPELKGVKAAFTYFSPSDLSSFYVYGTTDPRGEFLLELGMEFPENINSHFTPETGFALTLSAENADALNEADILVTYGDQALLEALQADPLFSQVPAIKRGSMVLIPDGTALAAAGNPNPLSIEYTTGEYLELVADAIQKINQ